MKCGEELSTVLARSFECQYVIGPCVAYRSLRSEKLRSLDGEMAIETLVGFWCRRGKSYKYDMLSVSVNSLMAIQNIFKEKEEEQLQHLYVWPLIRVGYD